MKTRSCNFDHLITNFYIVKLGFRQGNTPFSSFFLLKNRLWVYPQFIFELRKTTTKQQNDHNFRVKIVIYTVVKIQDYLLGCVNVFCNPFF